MLSNKTEGKGKRCWIPHSWKFSCLASCSLLQTEKGKTMQKMRQRNSHICSVLSDLLTSVAKEQTWCSRKLLQAWFFFWQSSCLWSLVISIMYQQLKENKNLKAIVVPKATVQAPKHSQGTRHTGKIPNPCRAAWCALRLSSEKAQAALKFQWYASIESDYSIIEV